MESYGKKKTLILKIRKSLEISWILNEEQRLGEFNTAYRKKRMAGGIDV